MAAAESSPDKVWAWKFRILVAGVLSDQDKPAEVLSELSNAGTPPSLDLQAQQEMLQGWAKYNQADYQAAQRFLAAARSHATSANDHELLDRIDSADGNVLAKMGRLDEAEAMYRRVILDAGQGRRAIPQGQALHNLGVTDNNGLRYEEALDSLNAAVNILSNTSDNVDTMRAIDSLGWAQLGLGDYESALENFDDAARKAAQSTNRLDEIVALNGAAKALLIQGKPAAAEARSAHALALAKAGSHPDEAGAALDDLAEAALAAQQWDRAQTYNDESRGWKRKADPAAAMFENVEIEGRIAAGRKDYGRAERLFRSITGVKADIDPAVVLKAHSGLAGIYASQGLAARAEAEFQATLRFSDGQRSRLTKDDSKLSYLASLMRFYRSYVTYLVDNHHEDRALEVVDSSRARLLAEKLIAAPRPRTAAEFRALARASRSVLMVYSTGPERSYVWVVTGSVIRLFPLAGEEELEPLIQAYGAAINEGIFDPAESAGSVGGKLWKLLIEPAASLIPPGANLILVPDGFLHSLNFETLLAPGNPAHYWIEDVTIRIAPSLGVLLSDPSPRKARTNNVLLIGAAESPGPEFPKLRNALDEMQKVKAHFGPDAAKLYQANAASPGAYRNADPFDYRFIHFATHSLPNRKSPLDSALILSPDKGIFKLYARDIAVVPVRAELVTISACKSAGGKAYSGEGQVGLAWAFLQAGASNVIAGLWNVNDASTPALMDRMYGEIEKGARAADALRTAKLAMIHSRTPARKAVYWGPFLFFTGAYR